MRQTCGLAVAILAFALSLSMTSAQDAVDVWVGTGRSALSKGIYHSTLNTVTGKLSAPSLAAEVDGPGFIAMHPSRPVIYAVCNVEQKPCVAAFAIEDKVVHPRLSFLNSVEIGDGGGTHLSVDRTGRNIVTAQYGGGSVALFSLNADGTLKQRTQLIEHEGGSNATPGRQTASHAHWAGFSPDNRFVFVPDLGLDQVVIYKFDATSSTLTRHGVGQLPAGSGPRHMKFHPGGRFIFVLNELNLTVTVFEYDAGEGTMVAKRTFDTLPQSDRAKEQTLSASEIRVHPNGHFVYSANRGHDTIAVFTFDAETGDLLLIENEHVRGATPRNFNIDPTGRWLLAAGQDSHTLASFEIDQDTGELTYNRSNIHTPSAICVMFRHE